MQKRSFINLAVPIDSDRLSREYSSIPIAAWDMTYWDAHSSSDMLLLRGGRMGTEADFSAAEVHDTQLLAELPYISWLIGEDGPFGRATYAFLFRMKPGGVSTKHVDANPAWAKPFRIHVPITTNDGAFLLSEGRSKHFKVGEVWTFDNQATHSVVNGDDVRTHLIFDVAPNPKLDRLLEAGRFDAGDEDPSQWQRSGRPKATPLFEPASMHPLSLAQKQQLGLAPGGFATRVGRVRRLARLMGSPLRPGDIIVSIDGATECPIARTATAYLRFHSKADRPVRFGILRGGRSETLVMTPRRDFTRSPAWRALMGLFSRRGHGSAAGIRE